jgi:hypothetical protein
LWLLTGHNTKGRCPENPGTLEEIARFEVPGKFDH